MYSGHVSYCSLKMFHAKVVDFNEAYILSHVQNFHYDQPCFKN
jgi:hypothetical protein